MPTDSPTPLPVRIWWEQVDRAVARHPEGWRIKLNWSHAVMQVKDAGPENHLELVPGRGWVEIPPDRWTDEYKAKETQRLTDELGVALGVGPKPR